MTVVDASVLVKWLTYEADSDRARALFHSTAPLHVPDLALFEVPAALAKKVHLGLISADEAQALNTLLNEAVGSGILIAHASLPLMTSALALSARLQHGLYDCVYLVLAQMLADRVVTADRKLLGAADRGGFGGLAYML